MDYSVDDLKLLVLNVGYAIHDKDWNWSDVSSPFTRLYYVTAGSAQIQIEDRILDLVPGRMYLVPSFTKHTNICTEHFEHYYIHIYEEGPSSNNLFEEYVFPFEVEPRAEDLMLFKRLCELNPRVKLLQSNPKSYDNQPTLIQTIRINKARDFQDKVESRGILFILVSHFLGAAYPKSYSGDNRIKKALSYIRKSADTKIQVKDLAKISALSVEHFIKVFKRETGETPNRYITRTKMEKAMVLLVTSTLPVKTIAFNLGYDDVSYFNRTFKSFAGMTPQQYRSHHSQ